MTRCATGLLAMLLVGCAPSIEPDGDGTGGRPGNTQVTVDGVVDMVVDATSEDDWVPYSFLEAAIVEDDEHVAFNRYRLRLGEGVSVARIAGGALEDPVDLSGVEWLVDAEDPVDDEDYAMFEWYDYDESVHVLTPKDERYVFRLGEQGEQGYVVLVFDDYYDDAGTPALVSIRWTVLETE